MAINTGGVNPAPKLQPIDPATLGFLPAGTPAPDSPPADPPVQPAYTTDNLTTRSLPRDNLPEPSTVFPPPGTNTAPPVPADGGPGSTPAIAPAAATTPTAPT